MYLSNLSIYSQYGILNYNQNFLIKNFQYLKYKLTMGFFFAKIPSICCFKVKHIFMNMSSKSINIIYSNHLYPYFLLDNKNANYLYKHTVMLYKTLNYKIKEFSNGLFNKLKIAGYIRRATFHQSTLFLKLGRSFVNKIALPKKILIRIIKFRMLHFFSNDLAFLNNYLSLLVKLNPSSPYKETGIIFFNKPVKLKVRQISSY